MELRNLTNFPTDYLDAYCDAKVGHTNWEFGQPYNSNATAILSNPEVHSVIIIYNNPEEADAKMDAPEE